MGSIQETLVEAGARGCLMLPIHTKEVTSVVARAQADNLSGRRPLGLSRPLEDDS